MTPSLHLVPREWRDVLHTVEDTLKARTILAGGALRDLFNGGEPKDLDLWVYVDPDDIPRALQLLKREFGEPSIEVDTNYLHAHDRSVLFLTEFVIDPLPVQVIFLTEPLMTADLLNEFDFGVCQIGMDARGYIYTTEAYDRDSGNHTLTYLRTEENFDRKLERCARLKAKYPHFEFRDRGGMHEFATG